MSKKGMTKKRGSNAGKKYIKTHLRQAEYWEVVENLNMNDRRKQIGERYFCSEDTAAEVAQAFGVTTATVYQVAQRIKADYAQRFAEWETSTLYLPCPLYPFFEAVAKAAENAPSLAYRSGLEDGLRRLLQGEKQEPYSEVGGDILTESNRDFRAGYNVVMQLSLNLFV